MTEHLPIQRYTVTGQPRKCVATHTNGEWVTYADHRAALTEAYLKGEKFALDQFEAGYADAIYTAIRRVEDLPVMTIGSYIGITEAQVLAALRDLTVEGDLP